MNAETRLRREITKCSTCEACRSLVNLSCAVFPFMFKLVDKEKKSRKQITSEELMRLVNLCTFCGACPCLDIRAAILEAKTEYMDKYGIPFQVRTIERVETVGRICGTFSRLANFFFQSPHAGALLKRIMGINPERKIPLFPQENFDKWIRSHRKKTHRSERKVVYFAGCSARYFYPDVAQAVFETFKKNDIEVYYPDQRCCGMPSLLEGDRKLTLKLAKYNVAVLADAVEAGYDIVCSCPTCGYMLKVILKTGAKHPLEYIHGARVENAFVNIPLEGVYQSVVPIPVEFFSTIVRDQGYFSPISLEKRILIAENTYDVGEYLIMLQKEGKLKLTYRPFPAKVAYYPPCHQREQGIGEPYAELMKMIPQITLTSINGNYCCGSGGIMGFKKEFYRVSVKIASRLIARLKSLTPDVIATDCLSCRLQLNQLLPYPVLHPVQIIRLNLTR